MRTVIGQTKKNEDAEESDKNRGRVEPYYITCMTITILGAVLAVVSLLPVHFRFFSSKINFNI